MSIKAVLPAAVPELSYNALDDAQKGGAAMEAYHGRFSSPAPTKSAKASSNANSSPTAD